MKAYACVYLHGVLDRPARRHAEYEAQKDGLVRRYLDSYNASNSFYDWGDDPSFFAATEILGSPDKASWGVCRPDVRAVMSRGDFVAFFCAKQEEVGERKWNYFWVGLGTVGQCLTRDIIWGVDDYEPYRHFLNILARPAGGALQQHERVNVHEDWKTRAAAPYILFDPKLTRFNLSDPLHVASYKRARGGIEEWRWGDNRVRQIGELILPDPRTRGLRTTNPYRPHAKMNLDAQAGRAGGFEVLREQLLALVDR